MKEATKFIGQCKDKSKSSTLPEIKDNINKQYEALTSKLAGWEEKNKKIWKEIVPKRFAQPEPISQDFGLTFQTVMQEY